MNFNDSKYRNAFLFIDILVSFRSILLVVYRLKIFACCIFNIMVYSGLYFSSYWDPVNVIACITALNRQTYSTSIFPGLFLPFVAFNKLYFYYLS